MNAPQQNDSDNIVLWGGPESGKTAFIAALQVALDLRDHGWNLVGGDQNSTDLISEMSEKLINARTFPDATHGIANYHWSLVGDPHRSLRRRWGAQNGSRRIGLNIIDGWGELYGSTVDPYSADRLLNHLFRSRAIVYFFDPIIEFERGDSHRYFRRMLNNLTAKLMEEGHLDGRKLPHHLAVCITKFDDPRVFLTADSSGLWTAPPGSRFPQVTSDKARMLFEDLAHVGRDGTARQVLGAINNFFHPSRVKFFVTSSVGFYIDRQTGVFDRGDFQNFIPPHPGHPGALARIRGEVEPINVLEPLLWLGERTA